MRTQHQNLVNELRELNNARAGSFGEFIFESAARERGMHIESQHTKHIDFLLEGQPIDVKAKRTNLDKPCESIRIRIFPGPRFEGIKYAMVEFFCDVVRLSIDGEMFSLKTWPEIYVLWPQWPKKPQRTKSSEVRDKQKEIISEIQVDLVEFFARDGLAMRTPLIYRTILLDKSADNLKPPPSKRHFDLTVYIDFRDGNMSRDNILRIIAFPHSCIDELPMAAPGTVHLHKPKVDVDIIDQKYLFKDLDDLKRNYRKRFLRKGGRKRPQQGRPWRHSSRKRKDNGAC